jgi:hypothetical protein
MGYCFDYRGRLACDGCGIAGGVRKRRCAYKVDGVPYCPAPALCPDCYKQHGGLRGVHGDECRDGAAQSQARADADKARIAAGDFKSRSAFGDWHELVPENKVGLLFYGQGDPFGILVDDADYDNKSVWFFDLKSYQPWPAGEARYARKGA